MSDKKFISLLIIAVMLLTSFAPIVSAATTDEVKIADSALFKALSNYDENGDGKLSQEEMKKVTLITIPKETTNLSGLEYAENLSYIMYNYNGTALDFSKLKTDNITNMYVLGLNKDDLGFLDVFTNLEGLGITTTENINVDISPIAQCKNLEYLTLNYALISDFEDIKTLTNLEYITLINNSSEKNSIDLAAISNFTNLTYLYMYGMDVKNVNSIGTLGKLDYLELVNCTGVADLSVLENNTTLTSVSLGLSDIADVSFVKSLSKLTALDLTNTSITEKEKASLFTISDYKAYIGESFTIRGSITGLLDSSAWDFESDNEEVATVDNVTVKTSKVGTANIKMTLKEDTSVSKTMKVTVSGISSNQACGSKVGSTFINEDIILNANGELWRIYEKEGKTEKIDTNVQKYVYEFVYNDNNEAFHYTLTQRKDGSVDYVFNGVKTTLSDVKDIYNNGYLANDGTYYTITTEGKWTKTTDNVEKIVGSYLVKNDGKTYTVANELVCDFKIVAASYNVVVDESGNVWEIPYGATKLKQIGENFKEFATAGDALYYTTDGKIMSIYGDNKEYLFDHAIQTNNSIVIDTNNQFLLNDNVILTNVVSATIKLEYDLVTLLSKAKVLLVRDDASVWCLRLAGEGELVKLTPQDDSVYFANEDLIVRPASITAYTAEILTGFNIRNLSVNEAIAATKFKEGYTAKAYKDEAELTGTEKISTGTTIKLYNAQGEVVEEYTALVYGDVTGSGNPSAKDALAIIKNKTGKLPIEDALYLEAARVTENTRKTAGVPNASDALAIVKAKLGKYTISM